MVQFDKQTLGKLLLEREVRPALVVDLESKVVEANRASRVLAGGEAVPSGRVQDWLKPSSRECFDASWKRAVGGERARATVGLEVALPFDPVLEFSPLMVDGRAQGVLLVMVDTAAPGPVLPLVPATGLHYEVSLDEAGRPAKLLRVVAAEPGKANLECGKPCWASIHGRDAPCERCPLTQQPFGRAVVRLAAAQPFSAQLLSARRTRDDLATVTAVDVDEQTWSALVRQRIEAMAQRAKLSGRERSVLELLMVGRSLSDIAGEVGITERTTKYHQQNLLKKLGADSRADLLRLFS
ncbi:MAG: LuxR C-terminal-related transcriptional regulator [Myxococcota bacterium]